MAMHWSKMYAGNTNVFWVVGFLDHSWKIAQVFFGIDFAKQKTDYYIKIGL